MRIVSLQLLNAQEGAAASTATTYSNVMLAPFPLAPHCWATSAGRGAVPPLVRVVVVVVVPPLPPSLAAAALMGRPRE